MLVCSALMCSLVFYKLDKIVDIMGRLNTLYKSHPALEWNLLQGDLEITYLQQNYFRCCNRFKTILCGVVISNILGLPIYIMNNIVRCMELLPRIIHLMELITINYKLKIRLSPSINIMLGINISPFF